MNISQTGSVHTQASMPTSESRRAQLQGLLLKKSLELQDQHAQDIMRETEGKGQRLDIRV